VSPADDLPVKLGAMCSAEAPISGVTLHRVFGIATRVDDPLS
jgi:hypothetical protein